MTERKSIRRRSMLRSVSVPLFGAGISGVVSAQDGEETSRRDVNEIMYAEVDWIHTVRHDLGSSIHLPYGHKDRALFPRKTPEGQIEISGDHPRQTDEILANNKQIVAANNGINTLPQTMDPKESSTIPLDLNPFGKTDYLHDDRDYTAPVVSLVSGSGRTLIANTAGEEFRVNEGDSLSHNLPDVEITVDVVKVEGHEATDVSKTVVLEPQLKIRNHGLTTVVEVTNHI